MNASAMRWVALVCISQLLVAACIVGMLETHGQEQEREATGPAGYDSTWPLIFYYGAIAFSLAGLAGGVMLLHEGVHLIRQVMRQSSGPEHRSDGSRGGSSG